MIMENHKVVSAADRGRQEQAFYDKFGDNSLKSNALKFAAAVALYAVAMAGISAALH
jgi:hypothetical protein